MTAISVRLISNCDDVHLLWEPDEPLPDCLGFAIYRKRNGAAPEILKNRVGFSPLPDQDYQPQPSTIWPFQRLSWTDHGGNTGDRLAYKIVAMLGTPATLASGPESDWTSEITLTPECGNGISAYFNRGVVLSQFVGRLMRKNQWTAADIKEHAGMLHDQLREFLSGDLRTALLALLDEAGRDAKVEMYAALFELTDNELEEKLEFLGARLHVVLANGAVKSNTEDENKDIRDRLVTAGAEVCNRMSAPAFLAHNKFAVLCREGKSYKVWTGSTNWQPTGLCTQVNNGVLVENEDLSAGYLAAWYRLKEASNGNGANLKEVNSVVPVVHRIGESVNAFARFTATNKQIDLTELSQLIAHAKRSIFFLMFMPGHELFQQIIDKGNSLYVRGVANTIPKNNNKNGVVNVGLVDGKTQTKFDLKVIEPTGIRNSFAYWAEEVTRQQFNAIGHAIIHSKAIVLDAGTPDALVITGSHNFSITASRKNDENYMAVVGNQALANAYVTNCMAVYDHYRWRKYIADCAVQRKKPWDYLTNDPAWLSGYMQAPARKAMLDFWFGEQPV